jgi:hypothetical protein
MVYNGAIVIVRHPSSLNAFAPTSLLLLAILLIMFNPETRCKNMAFAWP